MFILAKILSLNRICLFLEDCQYTGHVYKNTINLFLYTFKFFKFICIDLTASKNKIKGQTKMYTPKKIVSVEVNIPAR